MKQGRWIWVLILAVAVAAPLMAGGKGAKCTATAQDCLDKMVQKLENRGWVGIEMNSSDEDGTLTITRVVPDSPAEEAGLRPGDVLVAVNGIGFDDKNEEALLKVKKGMTVGKSITYTVARSGKKKEISLTLAPLPEAVMAEWIGRHMLEHATVDVAKK